ncbi:MAG TPA: MFS transporter [Chloroflexota bacterium]|nr:MFS transporter [Chloroflexota bacterium]
MKIPRGFAPLRERNFGLYWAGQAISFCGTWIENTATSWLLYELTADPVLLGLGGLFRAGPSILLTMIGGAIADRVPRRRLLLFTQSANGLTSLALGWLVWSAQIQPWQIYLFNLLNGTLQAFDGPARQALFPTLVPRGQIQAAVTLNAVSTRSAALVGPAIAGLLLAQVGTAAPFFLNAVSYLALVGALVAMRLPADARARKRTLRADLAYGLKHVRADSVLGLILVLEAISSLFGHNTAIVTIVARDVLRVGPGGLGLLLSGIAGGATVGIVGLVGVGSVRRKGRLLLISGALYVLVLASFALSRTFWVSFGLLFALGLTDSIWNSTRNTIAQLATPDELRGRVMAIVITASRGLSQASQAQTGVLVGWLGAPLAILTGAAVVGGSLLVAAIRAPGLRRFTGEPAAPGPA